MNKKPFGLQDLGRQISLARAASGLTQAELGRRIGVQRQAVYRLESGGRQPGALVLRSIALALGVTTDSLLGMEAMLEAHPFSAGPMDAKLEPSVPQTRTLPALR